ALRKTSTTNSRRHVTTGFLLWNGRTRITGSAKLLHWTALSSFPREDDPMATQRSVAIALIVGLVGLLVGRALPRALSKAEATASVKPMPPVPLPTHHDCKAERTELSSTNAQLAICKAYLGRAPETAPSAAPDPEATPCQVRIGKVCVNGVPPGWKAEF